MNPKIKPGKLNAEPLERRRAPMTPFTLDSGDQTTTQSTSDSGGLQTGGGPRDAQPNCGEMGTGLDPKGHDKVFRK